MIESSLFSKVRISTIRCNHCIPFQLPRFGGMAKIRERYCRTQQCRKALWVTSMD